MQSNRFSPAALFMLDTKFLLDPFTFHHRRESLGCTTFTQYLRQRYLRDRPAARALSLVCRNGLYDRILLAEGLFEKALGVDSDIANATRSDVITYETVSLDRNFRLTPSRSFPLIYSFHHLGTVSDVGGLLASAAKLLTPGGVFVFLGYCGPQHGITDKHSVAIVDRFLKCLPNSANARFTARARFFEEGLTNRSSHMIQGAIESLFSDVEVVELGGALAYPAWLNASFRPSYERDEDVSLTLLLQAMEVALFERRILNSIVKLIIARNP